MGPKRSTRKGEKEYMWSRKLLMEAARAKKKEDSVRDIRWERLHSEGSSGSSHRGTREEVSNALGDAPADSHAPDSLFIDDSQLLYLILSYSQPFSKAA